MNISNTRATVGLQAKATPTSTNVTGQIQIGANNEVIPFLASDVAYTIQAFFAGSADVLSLNRYTGSTTGSTAWVAGSQQIETAVASGTVSNTGSLSVTITASGLSGSPKSVSVPVLTGDLSNVVAEKIRSALNTDSAISAMFVVAGSTSAVTLSRKPTVITSGDVSVDVYPATDATLNIAIANGTASGLSPVTTSTNTQAGSATDGVLIYDGDGRDFEGLTLPTITTVNAELYKTINSGFVVDGTGDDLFSIAANGSYLFAPGLAETTYTFTSTAPGALQITVVGQD